MLCGPYRSLLASVVLGEQGIGAFLSKEKRDNPYYKVGARWFAGAPGCERPSARCSGRLFAMERRENAAVDVTR